MSNRPVIVDIKGLPWGSVPAVFEVLHEQAKERLKDGFDIYEVTENVSINENEITSEIISREDYEVSLSNAYFRYYGFDGDNDLIFREDLEDFALSFSLEEIVQELVPWRELLGVVEVEEEVPPIKDHSTASIAQQLFNLAKTGISGDSMVRIITQLASDTKIILPNASCFILKEDRSSIYIKVVRRTDAVDQHVFSLEPFVTYPHYRKFDSGMVVYKSDPTRGVIVFLPEGDHRKVGDPMVKMSSDEGVIVSANFAEV